MAARREMELILREIGAAQHGVAMCAQLQARGIAAHAIDSMVRVGRLVVLRRGVYQIGPLPATLAAEMAAALACGADGRISHLSAAAIQGVLDPTRARLPVEVIMPRRKRRRIEGIRIHRVGDLRPDEVATLDGIHDHDARPNAARHPRIGDCTRAGAGAREGAAYASRDARGNARDGGTSSEAPGRPAVAAPA